MAASLREHVTLMENEALMYWRRNQEGWERFRQNPLDPELADIRDDIEVMAEMTDWPLMREACRKCIRIDNEIRIPLLRSDVA